MASTNKTTNYELSQFLGTDKPAWISDYNSDMSKIDTGIHTAQTTATGADGKADTANTNIGNLENLTTSTKTSIVSAINEVDGHADTAQETANSASSNASSAVLEINNLKTYLDLNTFNEYDKDDLTLTNVSVDTATVNVARNTNGTLCKIYGRIKGNCSTGWSDGKVVLNFDTGLRPANDITIYAMGFWLSGSNLQYSNPVKGILRSNGKVEFIFLTTGQNDLFDIYLPPCLYFVKDFGDQ